MRGETRGGSCDTSWSCDLLVRSNESSAFVLIMSKSRNVDFRSNEMSVLVLTISMSSAADVRSNDMSVFVLNISRSISSTTMLSSPRLALSTLLLSIILLT